jgi:hypothetical protein
VVSSLFLKFLTSILVRGAFINPISPGLMGTSQKENIDCLEGMGKLSISFLHCSNSFLKCGEELLAQLLYSH